MRWTRSDGHLQPHRLCNYLYELSGALAIFYEQCPVFQSAGAVRDSRLALCLIDEAGACRRSGARYRATRTHVAQPHVSAGETSSRLKRSGYPGSCSNPPTAT